jgi:endonuclease YncB( thermonuclease family)
MKIPIEQVFDFQFPAQLIRVIDGDTIKVRLDRALHDFTDTRLRFLGLNCPEPHGDTREAGLAATAFTTQWLQEAEANSITDWPLRIFTHKSDDWERWLAVVYREVAGFPSLNDLLLKSGHAVPFP